MLFCTYNNAHYRNVGLASCTFGHVKTILSLVMHVLSLNTLITTSVHGHEVTCRAKNQMANPTENRGDLP